MTSKKKRKRIYYTYHQDIAPDKYLTEEGRAERERKRKESEHIYNKESLWYHANKRFNNNEVWEEEILEYLENNPNKWLTSTDIILNCSYVPSSYQQAVSLAIKYLREYENVPIITGKGKGYMYISKEA